MSLILNPYRFAASEANFYQDIVDAGLSTDLRLVFDIGSSSQDHSSQTLTNLVSGGVDTWRGGDSGSSTDDPTFNGASGGLSSSDYLSFDGGDFCKMKSQPSYIDDMHQDNAIYSLLIWLYLIAGATNQVLFETTTNLEVGTGITLFIQTAEHVQFGVANASTAVLTVEADENAISENAWHLIGMSLNEATGSGGGFFYLDGAFHQVSSADTFTSTYSSPSTGVATQPMLFGGNVNKFLNNNSRIAGVMLWSGGTAMTKANFDTIWTAQKGRFGL